MTLRILPGRRVRISGASPEPDEGPWRWEQGKIIGRPRFIPFTARHSGTALEVEFRTSEGEVCPPQVFSFVRFDTPEREPANEPGTEVEPAPATAPEDSTPVLLTPVVLVLELLALPVSFLGLGDPEDRGNFILHVVVFRLLVGATLGIFLAT